MIKPIILPSNLIRENVDYTSRNISEYMLTHSTLSSWKHFFHKPYKFDWDEATHKARERYIKYNGDLEDKKIINYAIEIKERGNRLGRQ